MRRLGAAAAAGLSLALTAAAPPDGGKGPRVEFNRDVRPILSEACFQCHGPDKAKRKGGLRLDTREGALAGSDAGGGPVIVPGKPDESEVVARITSDDPDEQMPPPDSGKSLTPGQVALIQRWLAQGAEYQGHWAYLPPRRPAVPDVPASASSPAGFVRNEVDCFILAALAGKGLRPSPEADRVTLIRRLSVDLRGLPPTPAEVVAFVNDPSPGAYERLVDRMLASPQYGERMATFWLDLVRYADTTGYHGDNHRDVALYRDYVIDAFNRNVPFDRFTVEQLAGDLLPGAGDAERIASGYNKLLMTTQEGGAQAKEYLAKYAADRVRNASTVWLGATLGCAECHDHKYDPFTTRDFYRFAAFFADIREVAVGPQEAVKVPTPEQSARLKTLEGEAARLRAVLDTTTPALAAAQSAWEASPGARRPEWTVFRPEATASEAGATLSVLGDGSVLASGKSPDRDTYSLTLKIGHTRLTALRLEVMPDGKLPALGPGRAENGNFVLGEFSVKAAGKPVAVAHVTATHAQAGFDAAGAADGKPETGWAILDRAGRPNAVVFELKEDVGCGTDCRCEPCAGTALTVTLTFPYGSRHTLGRFRLSGTDAARPVRAEAIPDAVAAALDTPAGARTDQQRRALASYYRSIAPELEPTRARLAEVSKAKADVEVVMPKMLVSRSGPPRVMRILPRGNWLDESGPVVTPAVPSFLSARAEQDGPRASRLDLARWVVAPDNPLTARVFVNRVWARAFGQGLVATLDDFGAQGAWPTHPELLDWLATGFGEGGWDVKSLVRLLVTSGTYRQSSRASDGLRQRDPYNQWFARQGRFRVDAEVVRDAALAVSGLLDTRVGGLPAKPYQPAGYWAHLNFPKREYQPDHGPGLYRRGLYTYWCRTFLHPSLLAFDAPTREECAVQRPRSNTPLQALVLLNDPTYVEAARALAERTLREGGDGLAPRVAWVYRTVLSRGPRPDEVDVVSSLYGKHLAEYRSDRPAAVSLIQTGERPVPADLDPAELAAWTSVARVVLNLHEAVTRN
jgi:hypothetical protein